MTRVLNIKGRKAFSLDTSGKHERTFNVTREDTYTPDILYTKFKYVYRIDNIAKPGVLGWVCRTFRLNGQTYRYVWA